jgi:hypothetical protein
MSCTTHSIVAGRLGALRDATVGVIERPQSKSPDKQLRPRLLLLDPLVRLHGSDENNAFEVAALLAYIRSLQRQLDLCAAPVTSTPSATRICTCGEVRKPGAPEILPGQLILGAAKI